MSPARSNRAYLSEREATFWRRPASRALVHPERAEVGVAIRNGCSQGDAGDDSDRARGRDVRSRELVDTILVARHPEVAIWDPSLPTLARTP